MTRHLVQPDVLTLNTEEVMSGLNTCYSNMQEPTYVRGIVQNQKKENIYHFGGNKLVKLGSA